MAKNVVRFPNAAIPPLDCEHFVSWLDDIRRQMTNGQPWHASYMARTLRYLSEDALRMAAQIERAGNVRPRWRFVVRRASPKAVSTSVKSKSRRVANG